nr:polysaccharide deacetylase [uncultured archaeon GZfos1D1]
MIKKIFNEFEKKIETLKRLEKELKSLDSEGFESEVEALKSKLKRPDKIPEIEKGIAELKRKVYDKSAEAIEIAVVPEVAPAPKNAYGVVIGIGKYKDEGIPALKYAKEDAIEIYNILTDPKYGGFPRENVKLLLDEQATLTEIKSAMGTFLARNAGENDMVCIYFAGHGSPELDPTGKADDKLEKFIVPYDAKKDDLFGYGLSMDVIREILDKRIESKRAVFFIDSCYSGEAGGRTFSRPDVAARNITISEKFLEQLSGEGRIIITASKPDELSLETDELKHGIFTYYLAEGLKGKADLNGDGVVTVDELYSYVYEQVTKKARQLGGGQHPLKKGTIVGEIPLTRCETEEMMRIKKLNLNASRLFDEGEYEEALAIWSEVLRIDEENAEALAGIGESKKKIEEMKVILREKQRRLLDLHNRGLPAKEYDEAMILLKKNPRAYTELERNIVEYIEKLLKGDISIDVYVDTLKLIKENYKRDN